MIYTHTITSFSGPTSRHWKRTIKSIHKYNQLYTIHSTITFPSQLISCSSTHSVVKSIITNPVSVIVSTMETWSPTIARNASKRAAQRETLPPNDTCVLWASYADRPREIPYFLASNACRYFTVWQQFLNASNGVIDSELWYDYQYLIALINSLRKLLVQ